MQVQILHQVELEYQYTIEMILPYFYEQLNKNQQIRIRQWIKKLSSVINNLIWRKNRNLYAKLLYAMLKEKTGLLDPFNKCPTEGSLPKLASYQITFNLRACIENFQKEYKQKNTKQLIENSNKQNIHSLSNTISQKKGQSANQQKSSFKNIEKYKLVSDKKAIQSKKLFQSDQTQGIYQQSHQTRLNKINYNEEIKDLNNLITQAIEFISQNYSSLERLNSKKVQINNQQQLIQLIQKIYRYQEENQF